MQQPLDILKKYWNHTAFREPQEAIIQSVLNGQDTFALMPTGGGKSICFQVPAMVMEGICLVISPLVALMKDQVQNLQKHDIKAIALTGGIPPDEVNVLLDNCRYGNYKFLYLSPERLQNEWVTERIKQLPINLVAVDEAHCVSQWGHDFRPAYLKIADLKKQLPKVPFMALTASATTRVKQDIIQQLSLDNPAVFQKSFTRENIAYMVFETEDKLYRMQQILSKYPQPSIIYVRNRKACHDISRQLISLGFTATFYHGGLTPKEKEANMQVWLDNKAQVIVATNAFGMGIDKPDVKTVIHIQLPENLECYYQEAGRAGRNGEKAFAVLLVNNNDIDAARNQFINVLPDKKFLKEVYKRLNSYLQIAYGEGINQTFPFDVSAFCQRYDLPLLKVYNALQFLDRQGIVVFEKEFSEKISLQFIIPGQEVMRYISLNPADEEMLLAILRNYPGIFDMDTPVNTVFIAKKAKTSESEVNGLLNRLAQNGAVILKSSASDSSITFNEIREDDLTINRVAKFLERQNDSKISHFSAVVKYAQDNSMCKSRQILEYFDETVSTNCGICSYCVAKIKTVKSVNQLAQEVLQKLEQLPMDSRGIEQALGLSPDEAVKIVQLLLESGKIKINSTNQYTLL